MKKLILALLVSAPCLAQKISINTADATTGLKQIHTAATINTPPKEDETIAANGILYLSAGYQEVKTANSNTRGIYFITLNIVHNDPRVGCLNQENGRVLVFLEDGSEIECAQISPSDCDPVGFNVDFMLSPKSGTVSNMQSNFEKLQRIQIKRIYVITSETSIKYTVKSSVRPELTKHFKNISEILSRK